MILLIFLISNLLTLTQALAEYRVFRLQIYDNEGNIVREFKYNLDPGQYVEYWPLSPNQKIRYTETWLCPGRTAPNLQFCKSPAEIQAELQAQQGL